MKCKNCGKKIGIEEKRCPYCNAVNELAMQHEQNMQAYDKKFQNTKGEVLDSAKKMEGLGVRAIILAILVIGIVILTVLSSKNYEDPDTEKIKAADAVKNAQEYATIMDDYLAKGEYVDFEAFVYSHEISFWDPPYDKFNSVNYCAHDYYECVRHLESVILRSTDPDYFDSTETNVNHFCTYVNEFQTTYEARREIEKNETYRAYMDDMQENLKALIRAYLKMSDGEVEEFMKLSDAKMAVRMEEVLGNE